MSKRIETLFYDLIRDNENRFLKDLQIITEKLSNSNARYKGEIIDFLYQPVFFNNEDMYELREICDTMTSIIKKCTKEYLVNPSFRKYFNFSRIMEDLILIDPGYENPVPIARYDIFYGEDFKFCELNGDGTSAMNEANTLEQIFMESDIISQLQEKYEIHYHELFISWLEELLKIYQEFGGKGKPTIAIADFLGLGSNEEFDTFKEKFEQRGYKTIICDPRDMTYTNGELFIGDVKIDLVYRRAVNKEVEARINEVEALIQAYKDKAVCVVGPFRSQIMHNKIFFEVLWNEEATGFLKEEEREFIRKHIPETFTLTSDTMEKVINQKDRYVIKPKDYYAGKGVVCGLDCSDEEWLTELKKGIGSEKFLIQEFSNFTSRKLPVVMDGRFQFEEYKTTLGLFVYNGKLNGLYSRVGRENVIAGIVESITLPSLVYEEKD